MTAEQQLKCISQDPLVSFSWKTQLPFSSTESHPIADYIDKTISVVIFNNKKYNNNNQLFKVLQISWITN